VVARSLRGDRCRWLPALLHRRPGRATRCGARDGCRRRAGDIERRSGVRCLHGLRQWPALRTSVCASRDEQLSRSVPHGVRCRRRLQGRRLRSGQVVRRELPARLFWLRVGLRQAVCRQWQCRQLHRSDRVRFASSTGVPAEHHARRRERLLLRLLHPERRVRVDGSGQLRRSHGDLHGRAACVPSRHHARRRRLLLERLLHPRFGMPVRASRHRVLVRRAHRLRSDPSRRWVHVRWQPRVLLLESRSQLRALPSKVSASGRCPKSRSSTARRRRRFRTARTIAGGFRTRTVSVDVISCTSSDYAALRPLL
jgi:hypothetical protein